ncbi:MAG TPA: hypothetical protein VII01_16550 [Solirubrobacteraceae bacterium]|jgi:hypothetical protein
MAGDRSRYGLAVSSLGAIVLAVSVFLPWYGISFTSSGIALAQHMGDQVAAQYGNASLQAYMASLHPALSALAGQQLGAVSAHQTLHILNVVLLVIAGLALLDALLPLARSDGSMPAGAGGSVVFLGMVAAACVAYRMLMPPVPAGEVVSLSLREGSWLALLGSLAMVLGGLWPRAVPASSQSDSQVVGAWSGLSGWTPKA